MTQKRHPSRGSSNSRGSGSGSNRGPNKRSQGRTEREKRRDRTRRNPSNRDSRNNRDNRDKKPVDEVAEQAAQRTDWGGVARKGASLLRPIPGADKGDAYASGVPERRQPRPTTPQPPQRSRPIQRDRAESNKPRRRPSIRVELPTLDPTTARDLSAAERQRLALRLKEAAEDFLAERFGDALKALRPLASRYNAVADVQELYGLTLYRLGRWTAAAHRLERYEQLSGAVDQLPVLADCYRALDRLNDVHAVWDRLRYSDPDARTITEGRIVAAGALADEGRTRDAIRLLEAGPVRPKRPKEHHLRLWYALADLYDRVGDLQRARRGFARIADVEPGFVDVTERLETLGAPESRG